MADHKELQLTGEVVYVTSDEHSRNWIYNPKSEKVSKRIQWLSIDDVPNIRKESEWQLPSRIYEGDVLIRHPYDADRYIQAEKASYEIRRSKYLKITEIAQKLGATGCVIKEALENIEERKFSVEGDVTYEIKSGLNITHDKSLKETMGIKFENKFDGIERISQRSYEDAITLAEKYNLWEDEEIRSLINMRNPNQENLLRNRTLTFDMTREANERLDIAFSLTALPGVFSIDAPLKRTLIQRESIKLEILYSFP